MRTLDCNCFVVGFICYHGNEKEHEIGREKERVTQKIEGRYFNY